MRHFELLTLGDELLLGLATNSHLSYIGSQLARRGVMLQRNISVSDDADVIARQFAESWRVSDAVITTGGLGPTCDDRTREAIAQVLGQKLVHDDAVEQAIRERFAKRGFSFTPNNLKQAQRPERAEVLPNANGTAPGLWVEQDGERGRKVLCMLPGPPNELRPMFVEQVLPRLARLGLIAAEEMYVQLRTIGIGESMLETKLQPIFAKHGANDVSAPHGSEKLNIAYCAHQGSVDCRINSPAEILTHAELETIARECGAQLGQDLLCYGHDALPQVVANLLLARKKLLAIAEDATGGLLADCFNDILSVNHIFAGGAICHTHESKMQLLDVPEAILLQHGDASVESAVAMAIGAAERLGADYALAVTGFAGDAEHGGPVYVGLHSPRGTWAKTVHYPGTRFGARERVLTMALDWLRRELLAD